MTYSLRARSRFPRLALLLNGLHTQATVNQSVRPRCSACGPIDHDHARSRRSVDKGAEEGPTTSREVIHPDDSRALMRDRSE
jgi:hypothetical protein